MAPVADPTTRLFPVEALVSNPGLRLKAGMVAAVVTVARVPKRLPAVPVRSIRRLGTSSGFAVLAVSRNVVQLREVTLGPTQGDRIAILTGARSGELIVEDAGTGLRDGDPVRVLAEQR